MKTALRINRDMTTEVLDLSTKEYEQLSSAVDGWIQAVDLNPNLTLWCNEEGKMRGMEPNVVATVLWKKYFGNTDVIVGDVVFTGSADSEGETCPLADAQVAQLQRVAAEIREVSLDRA
jgi:hypothetical protein